MKTTERKAKMKKIFLLITAFLFCFLMISCDEVLPGIGDGSGEVAESEADILLSAESLPPQNYDITDVSFPETTWQSVEIEVPDEIEWKNFVLVGGVMYSSDYMDTAADASMIGERLGEITYCVTTEAGTSESQVDYAEAKKADFAAAYRDVGCGVYRVMGDENAIAVLDGGIYYLYILEG